VLELGRRPIRRVELDVQVVAVVGTAVDGSLVDGHDVRQGEPEQGVVGPGDLPQRRREPVGLARRQLGQPADVAAWREVDLERPAGEERDAGDPIAILEDDPSPIGSLLLQ